MKALWRVEARGWGLPREPEDSTPWLKQITDEGRRANPMPWCAEITGLSARYGYERRFLDRQVDCDQGNSRMTRGVYYLYTLVEGRYYETYYRTSWKNSVRKFLTVRGGRIVRGVAEEEVKLWLAEKLNIDWA